MLDGLIEDVRRGKSRSLVLEGDAGIGKTALLEYVIGAAADLKVVRVIGVQSEMELAYASLHQMCAPMLDRLDTLPTPQRDALQIIFGLSSSPAPDRFLVGLGVLTLVSEAAEQRPLLCVVDDAQWLDRASALTLAFVARRLQAEPVGIVFAAREPGEEFEHVPKLDVRGLRNGHARALLGAAVRFKLDERVRDRIVAETSGNPLALLELPQGLTATQLAGGFGLPQARALTGRIEESFVRRLSALSHDARRLLLLAAAEPVGDPRLLRSAAERLGIGPEAAEDEEAQRLLAIGGQVTFHHPLVRSAVYRSAAVRERRAVHLALAEATDSAADPDRRAWHLAAASAGPDEQVALELERSAGRAAARGGLAAAAAFLSRGAALTPEPNQRARRELEAAEAERQAGDPEAALRAVAAAEAGPLDPLGRAKADLLRARVAFGSGAEDAVRRLFEAARQLEPLDIDLARETYLDALGATIYLGPEKGRDPVGVARAALAAERPGPARPTDLLLDGVALQLTEGYAAAAETLRRAFRAFASEEISADVGLGWGWLASHVASSLWLHDIQYALATRHVRLAREGGLLSVLPHTLVQLVGIQLREGELDAASAVMREVEAAVSATRSDPLVHVEMVMAAYQGREEEGRRLIEESRAQLAPDARGITPLVIEFADLLLHNGLGRYAEGFETGRRVLDDLEPVGRPPWALPELVEAAARAGAIDEATAAMRQLSERAAISGTDWAVGLEARSRALLSDGDDAEQLYREAIRQLASPGSRIDLARAHLVYGEWLRREGRRVDARQQLITAHEMLIDMCIEAFAERARIELLATGERARKRTVDTRDDLTAQERQIAQLACDGLSNPEIGARLFLSPRTVEWHLRKVFGKLGIHRRRELAAALSGCDSLDPA